MARGMRCCAAGFNIRWLLQAIARGGITAIFLALIGLRWMYAHRDTATLDGHERRDLVVAS